MLRISAKDIHNYLKENDLKNADTAKNAEAKDLLYHGFLARIVEKEERKYIKQGVLLGALGVPMAIFSTATFPVVLGAVGATVGAINIFNSVKDITRVNDILKALTLAIDVFEKITPEESKKFFENMDYEDFDKFLDRTYFCESEM